MKRIIIATAIAAAAVVAVVAIFAPTRVKRAEWTTRPAGAEAVSLVSLIATPERYDGKKVFVAGYVVIEFEGTGIYLHEEDAERALMMNGLWLGFGKEGPRAIAQNPDACPGYAHVEAVFRAPKRGFVNTWSGGLTDVTRLEFYPKEKGSNKSPETTRGK